MVVVIVAEIHKRNFMKDSELQNLLTTKSRDHSEAKQVTTRKYTGAMRNNANIPNDAMLLTDFHS